MEGKTTSLKEEIETKANRKSSFVLTAEDSKKLKSIQKEYTYILSKVEDKTRVKNIQWRNEVRVLPLFDCKNENDSLRLIYSLFGKLDLYLFDSIFDNEELSKIIKHGDYYSYFSYCSHYLIDKYKKFHSIFYFDFNANYNIALAITLVDKQLGSEKAAKLDRTIKYELGYSNEKEDFGKADYGELWYSFIDVLKNGGDYWKEVFENYFTISDEGIIELSERDKNELRRRVVVWWSSSHKIKLWPFYIKNVPRLDEAASIIKEAKRLKLKDEEIVTVSIYCRDGRSKYNPRELSIFEIIQYEMASYKQSNYKFINYIEDNFDYYEGNVSFIKN